VQHAPDTTTAHPTREQHAALGTTGWLRPLVLGAEDGIVSTAALVIGVAAANASAGTILTTGIAGMTAGALSMAVGEYVSVAAQRDSEHADIARERRELEELPEAELAELEGILRSRGLDEPTARAAAAQMTEHDALGTHLREELALHELLVARPWQAAFSSAGSFATGALIPVLAITLSPAGVRIPVAAVATLVMLALAGAIGARLGRSAIASGTARLVVGGGAAMAITWGVGAAAGTVGL